MRVLFAAEAAILSVSDGMFGVSRYAGINNTRRWPRTRSGRSRTCATGSLLLSHMRSWCGCPRGVGYGNGFRNQSEREKRIGQLLLFGDDLAINRLDPVGLPLERDLCLLYTSDAADE